MTRQTVRRYIENGLLKAAFNQDTGMWEVTSEDLKAFRRPRRGAKPIEPVLPPDAKAIPNQRILTIGQVAERYGVNVNLVMAWEKRGLIRIHQAIKHGPRYVFREDLERMERRRARRAYALGSSDFPEGVY